MQGEPSKQPAAGLPALPFACGLFSQLNFHLVKHSAGESHFQESHPLPCLALAGTSKALCQARSSYLKARGLLR